jgi:hypothetical protein
MRKWNTESCTGGARGSGAARRPAAALVLEHLRLVLALVDQLDAHAGIQERELAQALGQDVVDGR